jgi:hypothetical protein
VTSATLVLVHGRAQERKDPAGLKAQWVDTLRFGLGKERSKILEGIDIRFPYYGDVLDQFLTQMQDDMPADIMVRGDVTGIDDQYLRFHEEILNETRNSLGITDAQVDSQVTQAVRERGPLNWEWVQAILRTLDILPGVSAAAIEQFTRDVYVYLSRSKVRKAINDIVKAEVPFKTVIVGHSLGSVVSYDLLRGATEPLDIRLYVTVGSPLAVGPIRRVFKPLKYPHGVKSWYNAFDQRDAVALHALDAVTFRVDPPIENYDKVRNGTENAHGIIGYLNDAVIAKRIYDALV